MAYATLKNVFLLLELTLAIAQMANAGDSNIVSDFIFPTNVTVVDGNFFTFTGLRALTQGFPKTFKVTKVSMAEFLALNEQSVSYAVLQYPAGTVNPPAYSPQISRVPLRYA